MGEIHVELNGNRHNVPSHKFLCCQKFRSTFPVKEEVGGAAGPGLDDRSPRFSPLPSRNKML
jgi:hypothetical protein